MVIIRLEKNIRRYKRAPRWTGRAPPASLSGDASRMTVIGSTKQKNRWRRCINVCFTSRLKTRLVSALRRERRSKQVSDNYHTRETITTLVRQFRRKRHPGRLEQPPNVPKSVKGDRPSKGSVAAHWGTSLDLSSHFVGFLPSQRFNGAWSNLERPQTFVGV